MSLKLILMYGQSLLDRNEKEVTTQLNNSWSVCQSSKYDGNPVSYLSHVGPKKRVRDFESQVDLDSPPALPPAKRISRQKVQITFCESPDNIVNIRKKSLRSNKNKKYLFIFIVKILRYIYL